MKKSRLRIYEDALRELSRSIAACGTEGCECITPGSGEEYCDVATAKIALREGKQAAR